MELRFYVRDYESKMRLLKTHSHTSNRLAMEPETREEKQLEEPQTLPRGKRHPLNPAACRRCGGGGGDKALEPATCRRCGGRGQERLYGESTTDKVLWRGDPSSILRGAQAPTKGRHNAKNPRGPSTRRGVRRGNDKNPGWKVATRTAQLGGEVSRRKNKVEQIPHTKDNR